MADPFLIVLRGYDMAQVDAVLKQTDAALASGSDTTRAAARATLRDVRFPTRLRGYDRAGVDRAVRERLERLG